MVEILGLEGCEKDLRMTTQQTQDIVDRYLEAQPEVRHKLAVILIHQVATQAFPFPHKRPEINSMTPAEPKRPKDAQDALDMT
jgi:hypothetical protein